MFRLEMYSKLFLYFLLLLSTSAFSNEEVLLQAEYLIFGERSPVINNMKLKVREGNGSAKFFFTQLSINNKYINNDTKKNLVEEVLLAAESGLPEAISFIHTENYLDVLSQVYPELQPKVMLLREKNDLLLGHDYVHLNRDTIHSELDRLIEAGNAQAIYLKGITYYRGKQVERSFKKSWDLLEHAAALGNGNAACFLSRNHGAGIGRGNSSVPALSKEREEELFWIAINDNNPECNYHRGLGYYTNYSNNEARKPALDSYLAAAKAGHLQAMFNLAGHYLDQGEDKSNFIDALHWLEKADYLNHPKAWSHIVKTYSIHPGNKIDLSEMMSRHKASNQNNRVAEMYEKGVGVSKDLAQAWFYYDLAGNKYEASRLKDHMPPNIVEENSIESKSNKKSFPVLQFMLLVSICIFIYYIAISIDLISSHDVGVEDRVVINNSRGLQLHHVMTVHTAKIEINKGNYEEAKLILSEYLKDEPLDAEAQKLFEIAVKWS